VRGLQQSVPLTDWVGNRPVKQNSAFLP